jgi:nitric oxide reductase subunit B
MVRLVSIGRSPPVTRTVAQLFIIVALCTLLVGALFGTIAAWQYLDPTFLNNWLPFHIMRPLHATGVVAWIILSVVGGVYYYLSQSTGDSSRKPLAHFLLTTLAGVAIAISLMLGTFGGREYLAFPPILSLPIVIGWICFAWYYFQTARTVARPRPIYLWMWGTGVVFFLFTLAESYAWMIPAIGDHLVRDIIVQWKSYGALIGSCNMLIYGTAIYVMHHTTNNESLLYDKRPFVLYFIGLTNLMFGWAHHTYAVPAAPWLRHIAYGISMTELIILASIIRTWSVTIRAHRKHTQHLFCRLLLASNYWIALNLIVAILISIPVLNLFTHGTHITVAHAMGSTIGINTMILLASVYFIATDGDVPLTPQLAAWATTGYRLMNIALLVFWISLILAGLHRGAWMQWQPLASFQEMMHTSRGYFTVFAVAGTALFAGLAMTTIPALWLFIRRLRQVRHRIPPSVFRRRITAGNSTLELSS